jgi:hypothetical protein
MFLHRMISLSFAPFVRLEHFCGFFISFFPFFFFFFALIMEGFRSLCGSYLLLVHTLSHLSVISFQHTPSVARTVATI